MALSGQDFAVGVDFTALTSITASDLENAVNEAQPYEDNGNESKSLNLRTLDSGLDTPRVPDPDALPAARWKRYIWIRVPHSSAADLTPLIYAWNDDVSPADPTFLKWKQIVPDTAEFEAAVEAAQDDATNALAQANLAVTTANNANSAATTALSAANAAQTSATAAASAAAAANVAATEALSTANEANDKSDQAVAIAGGKKDVNAALNPGTAGQNIETNSAATGVQWFSPVNKYAKVSYSPAKGTNPDASVANTWNHRKVATEDNDSGNLVTLAANVITVALAGTYRVRAIAVSQQTDRNIAILIDNDTDDVLLAGTNAHSNSAVTCQSIIDGVVTLTAGQNLSIQHYTEAVGKFGGASANNIKYPLSTGADLKEVYLTCEFWKLD